MCFVQMLKNSNLRVELGLHFLKTCVVVIWIDLNGAWCEKVGWAMSALCNEVALIWWNRPDGQVMGS